MFGVSGGGSGDYDEDSDSKLVISLTNACNAILFLEAKEIKTK